MKDNFIFAWFRKQDRQHNESWLYIMLARPSLYLFTLLKKTLMMGIYLLIFYEIIKELHLTTQPIPSTFHSVLGVVIGLLLVFRSNSAYERWWEARKILASFQATLLYLKAKAVQKDAAAQALTEVNSALFEFVSTSTYQESIDAKNKFLYAYQNLNDVFKGFQLPPPVFGSVENRLFGMMESFLALERIKSTPIPVSYSLHIKLSLFAYLMTLPIGAFFDIGYIAIPLVMLLFFIISGIEIISLEIENPFQNSPNDLPLYSMVEENSKNINL